MFLLANEIQQQNCSLQSQLVRYFILERVSTGSATSKFSLHQASWRQLLQSIVVLAAFFTALGDAGDLLTWKAILLNWKEGTTPSHHAVILDFELFLTLDCVKKEIKIKTQIDSFCKAWELCLNSINLV